jgi:hypothetical protein
MSWRQIEAFICNVEFQFLPQLDLFGVSKLGPGNTKGGSITVPLTSCLIGLDYSVLQIKTKIVSSHTADSKPVKPEVNGTVILPPLVFPAWTIKRHFVQKKQN